MRYTSQAIEAKQKLMRAALQTAGHDHYADADDPNWDAHADYLSDQLALAARDLTHSVDGMPDDAKPVDW